MIRVGIDAGGTFTDCVALVGGALRACKLRSRPDDPAAVVKDALRVLLPEGAPGTVEIVFSTTAATNALLERSGGPVVLLTTAGFEDVLEIGRQSRPLLYALHPLKPVPLVDAADRAGVDERIGAGGVVVRPLEEPAIAAALAEVARRPDARIAVCFLHAHANGAHEAALATRLRAAGHGVSVSSEICPLPREYERTSTTVADAYVAPRLGATLGALRGKRVTLRVMESTGGVRGDGAVRPARTILSGPAAGLVAMERLVIAAGLDRALALDVGGTSTDVALVERAGARRLDEVAVGGVTIALPSLAVDSVGAGGGSIAWIDGGGALHVGPRSAGAAPGPAAYGQGGVEPTLTDAHVVLGRLGGAIAGGAVTLDQAKARAAIATLGAQLGADVEATAAAVVAVADAAIVRALGGAARGEPVDALLAYGGAAGLHVVTVARELGVRRALVPSSPGLACAIGALQAPILVEELAACAEQLGDGPSAALSADAQALRARVAVALEAEGLRSHQITIDATARARYDGQGLDAELELPFARLSADAFADAHALAHGYRLERPVVVTQLAVRGRAAPAALPPPPPRAIGWPRRGARAVVTDGGTYTAPIYRRDRLMAERVIAGPALVEELSSTLWLPLGARATVSKRGWIDVEVGADV